MSPAVRWISIVVGLLVGNAIAVFVLIGAAGGDTSRRVLPDYYGRAAHWDDRMAEAAASARLGWRGDLVADGRTLELTLRGGDAAGAPAAGAPDAGAPTAGAPTAGAPIVGATVTVRGTPRGRADEVREVALVEVAPGVYRGRWPGGRGGLHTLELIATRGADRWVADRVTELGAPGAGAGTP